MLQPDVSAERHPHGEARTEVVDDRIRLVTVDRTEPEGAFEEGTASFVERRPEQLTGR